MQYRSPALTGDATFLNAEVVSLKLDDPSGNPIATLKVVMTNQENAVMATGKADVMLPRG
jgi:acyl dehydratase